MYIIGIYIIVQNILNSLHIGELENYIETNVIGLQIEVKNKIVCE